MFKIYIESIERFRRFLCIWLFYIIFQEWELLVLQVLNWDLSTVTPYTILNQLLTHKCLQTFQVSCRSSSQNTHLSLIYQKFSTYINHHVLSISGPARGPLTNDSVAGRDLTCTVLHWESVHHPTPNPSCNRVLPCRTVRSQIKTGKRERCPPGRTGESCLCHGAFFPRWNLCIRLKNLLHWNEIIVKRISWI